MEAIKVGNVILMKDKLVNISQEGERIKVVTTVCETSIEYPSEEDAKNVLDEFYKQLNKE